MMDPNAFTEKTRAALVAAQQAAQEAHHPQVEPAHLAVALFADEGGLAGRLAGKLGATAAAIAADRERELEKIPAQDPPPPQIGLSADLAKVIQAGQDEQKKRKDSHLAVEHLVLALA